MPVHIGDPAPAFSGVSDDGQHVNLRTLAGRWTVLFFFPRASSAHCALEARRFQKLWPDFQRLDVSLIGVSTDAPGEQAYFRSTCVLGFPLLSDDGAISAAFGVLGATPFDDESASVRRAARHSFLIAPDGRVAQHWEVASPGDHADEVLADLKTRLNAELV